MISALPHYRVTAKMRLYLAVAVLMLALVAYTGRFDVTSAFTSVSVARFFFSSLHVSFRSSPAEAQDDNIQQRFTDFGETISELGRNVAEKAKDTAERIHNSDFAVNARYPQHTHARARSTHKQIIL